MAYFEESDLLWKRLVNAKHIPRRHRRPGAATRRDYPDGDYQPVELDLADPHHRWPDIIVPIAQTPD